MEDLKQHIINKLAHKISVYELLVTELEVKLEQAVATAKALEDEIKRLKGEDEDGGTSTGQ